MKIKKIIYYTSSLLINRLLYILPVKRKRLLFLSDVREEIGGSFKLINDKLDSSYNVMTSFKADRRIRRSFKEWLKLNYNIATCEYILLDDFSEATALIKVKKNQQLIQLWHGSGAYKKFGHSRVDDLSRIHPGYKKYTTVLTSAESINECYAQAFNVSIDKVKALGIPRTDIFFNDQYKENITNKFYKEYPELINKKIILLAPTYRGIKVSEANYDFDKLNIDYLYDKLGKDYVILVKWHPALYNNIKMGKVNNIDINKYNNFIYDFSEYREVNDLLFITDILITDYSSIIFDYALLNKPIIYYSYDKEIYENDRGLYFEFNDYVYGNVVTNIEELVNSIINPIVDNDIRNKFIKRFVEMNDGNSTTRFINEILK